MPDIGNILQRYKDTLSSYALTNTGDSKSSQNAIPTIAPNGCSAINDSFRNGKYELYDTSANWPASKTKDDGGRPTSLPSFF